MQHHDDLPVNISFIMESGGIGFNISRYVFGKKHAETPFGADFGLWERDQICLLEQLDFSGGNKGIDTFDAKVKSADVDIL